MRLPRWLRETDTRPNATCLRCHNRFREDFIGIFYFSGLFNVLCEKCWEEIIYKDGEYGKWVMTCGG